MIEDIFHVSLASGLSLFLGLYGAYLIVTFILDPLRDIPGPFLARFTRLWYLIEIYKGDFEHTNITLHKKYGLIVRFAPNEYSIDDPEAAKVIYSIASGFLKVSTINRLDFLNSIF